MAHRPKQKKEHPPLDANFFRRVEQYGRHRTLFTTVQAQARRLDIDDLARPDPSVGLEDYIGRLFFNVHHDPAKAPTGAYFDMIDLYAWEVIETTEWMMGRSGPIKRVLQKELGAGRNLTIITFNIDLLIENALQELTHSRPGARWSIRDTYGFSDPLKTATRPGSGGVFNHDSTVSAIALYKLHGSVNWLFQHRDYHPPPDLVSQRRAIWQLLNKHPGTGRQKIRSGRSGRSVWYASPLIVPPVYEKHAFIRMHLQEIWENAEKALAEADRVVFWGYSFPAADTHARHFFEGLADRNPVLRDPILINPDPSTGAALWSLLRARKVTQYGDVSDYLRR